MENVIKFYLNNLHRQFVENNVSKRLFLENRDMSKFFLRKLLFLTVFLALSWSEKCPLIKYKSSYSYLTFDFWRAVAVLGRSTYDEDYFNIFNGLNKVMNCLTAEIYSWYDYGVVIEFNCIMEKFQKSNCPGAYIAYNQADRIPNTTTTPAALMT